ncbi:uncharacterized protein LOC103191452 [Callorhinchus milii]|uniref:uncharacterized protein LOC103191452 n=1 Tax=Callorhinchus milii TaxID=7868 RepID=UPI001C3FEED1|nr:uncharacterized protein LOC103191452 [Callorhinchus milii]
MDADEPRCLREDTLTLECIEFEVVIKAESTTLTTQPDIEISQTLGNRAGHEAREALLWLACLTVVVTGVFILVTTAFCVKRSIKRRREARIRRETGRLEGSEECNTLNKNDGRCEASPSSGSQGNGTGPNPRNGIPKDSGCREQPDCHHEEVWDGGMRSHLHRDNYVGSNHWDPSFPLPATELGPTALVTTKTTAVNPNTFLDGLGQGDPTDSSWTTFPSPPSAPPFHPAQPLTP